jgi:FMN phosphatase YigB (HAD superfamily)
VDVVFLDWGGTLMVDDGSQSGPMAGWPEVTAVEGAQEALEALRPDYRLVVATNADDSGARDVRAALFRVGLDGLVDDVVSSRDIGARKPDRFFYRAALLRAGRGGVPLAVERAVMVGDSWPNDVAGARAAGLRAVWFNPGRAPRPAGAEPPDAEIARLADLPAALAALQGGAGVRRGRGEGDADPGPGG